MGIEWLKPAAFIGSIVYALIGVLIRCGGRDYG